MLEGLANSHSHFGCGRIPDLARENPGFGLWIQGMWVQALWKGWLAGAEGFGGRAENQNVGKLKAGGAGGWWPRHEPAMTRISTGDTKKAPKSRPKRHLGFVASPFFAFLRSHTERSVGWLAHFGVYFAAAGADFGVFLVSPVLSDSESDADCGGDPDRVA